MTMNMTNIDKQYQVLATEINDFIPTEWKTFYLYGEVYENTALVYYSYIDITTNLLIEVDEMIKKYSIPRKVEMLFTVRLSHLLQELREEFKKVDSNIWNTITFILEPTGKFNITFGYDSLDTSTPQDRRKKWKQQYLQES